MVSVTPLLAALDRSDFRVTEPRRAVAQLVADQPGHFSAADLVTAAEARRLSIGRATIFRTLDVLADLDLVERIDLPSVCSRCGRSHDIDDAGLRAVVRDVARRTGYRIDEHRLELFGLCPECQGAESTL